MDRMGRKDDMKRKYETIIFDMDGTVLDTLEDLTDAVNYAMRKTELPEHSIRGGVRVCRKRRVSSDGALCAER